MSTKKVNVTPSSGNVFADLGLPEAEDRLLKAPIYGEAQVPEYWIVDITGEEIVVHVHTRPTKDGYQHVGVLRNGDILRPTKLAGIEIAVAEIPWHR